MIFNEAIEIILEKEGGLIDHPEDPGGLTNFGIAQKYHPDVDIRNLTKEDAKKIYYFKYFLEVRGNELPDKLRLIVLDCAVNQGTSACIKMLQRCLGVVDDGDMGPRTMTALSLCDVDEVMRAFILMRMKRYVATNNARHFLKGWMNRVIDISIASGVSMEDVESVMVKV